MQPRSQSMSESKHILFVTGQLAESSLRRVLEELAPSVGFDAEIAVLPITVAALLHTNWVAKKLNIDGNFDLVLLPGYCQGDTAELDRRFGSRFEFGPKDLHDLPTFFGQQGRVPVDLSKYDVEILAEINHAPRMSDGEILSMANGFRESGADVIDLGCIPGESWARAGSVTRQLVTDGFRVSIDSFDRDEVESSIAAGAELILSCNQSNLSWITQLGTEVVVIPDDVRDITSLEASISELQQTNTPFRVDPIIEPIGFGFTESLARYFECRRRWPDAEMMMGIGNLTELTEVDSSGMNMLFAAICQELGIHSVLTTEVINWCRTAVAEFDVARRLALHAVTNRVLPKHVDGRLVMLRDSRVIRRSTDELTQLQSQLTDPNFRIFAELGEIHVMNRDGYWHDADPYFLLDQLLAATKTPDATHAFYLGYELSKARTALTLGKNYVQDQALDWGLLTVDEISAHERRREGG